MGHSGGFGYMLWATVAYLVMRYGPPRGMKSYSKICDDFCATGYSAGFGYALWALKGLSHEIEMNYKWYKVTGPS
jgi:hypothetical protein